MSRAKNNQILVVVEPGELVGVQVNVRKKRVEYGTPVRVEGRSEDSMRELLSDPALGANSRSVKHLAVLTPETNVQVRTLPVPTGKAKKTHLVEGIFRRDLQPLARDSWSEKRLGSMLCEAGVLKPQQLHDILRRQQDDLDLDIRPPKLGQIATESGWLEHRDLETALENQSAWQDEAKEIACSWMPLPTKKDDTPNGKGSAWVVTYCPADVVRRWRFLADEHGLTLSGIYSPSLALWATQDDEGSERTLLYCGLDSAEVIRGRGHFPESISRMPLSLPAKTTKDLARLLDDKPVGAFQLGGELGSIGRAVEAPSEIARRLAPRATGEAIVIPGVDEDGIPHVARGLAESWRRGKNNPAAVGAILREAPVPLWRQQAFWAFLAILVFLGGVAYCERLIRVDLPQADLERLEKRSEMLKRRRDNNAALSASGRAKKLNRLILPLKSEVVALESETLALENDILPRRVFWSSYLMKLAEAMNSEVSLERSICESAGVIILDGTASSQQAANKFFVDLAEKMKSHGLMVADSSVSGRPRATGQSSYRFSATLSCDTALDKEGVQ